MALEKWTTEDTDRRLPGVRPAREAEPIAVEKPTEPERPKKTAAEKEPEEEGSVATLETAPAIAANRARGEARAAAYREQKQALIEEAAGSMLGHGDGEMQSFLSQETLLGGTVIEGKRYQSANASFTFDPETGRIAQFTNKPTPPGFGRASFQLAYIPESNFWRIVGVTEEKGGSPLAKEAIAAATARYNQAEVAVEKRLPDYVSADSLTELYQLIRQERSIEGSGGALPAEEVIRSIENGSFGSVTRRNGLRQTAERLWNQEKIKPQPPAAGNGTILGKIKGLFRG